MMKTNKKKLGLYLHIPFCIRKCKYCDFLSYTEFNDKLQSDYTQALIKEIEHITLENHIIDSVFIGGGTPTLLKEEKIDKIIDTLYRKLTIQTDAEITIESNPKTLTKRKLTEYNRMGINRLSIGAQSMDDSLLNFLGRIHSSKDFKQNFQDARDCGFNNINVDLMFAIPGQDLESWRDTLKRILELEPEHISFYSLQIEEGTPFFDMFKEGSLEQVSDKTDRMMYRYALALLQEQGYFHYEISNVAKLGFQCIHNVKYWSMQEYLGIGLGAHSYMEGYRFSNETNLKEYLNKSENVKINQKLFKSPYVIWSHMNNRQDDISEYIFTGLRKIEGISLADFQRRFNIPFMDIYGEEVLKHRNNGLIEKDKSGQWIRLTKRGIDLANIVLVDFV